MIILKAISIAQSIGVYVRDHTATTYTVTITDEMLHDVSSTTGVSGVYADGVLTLDVTHNFKEGNFYAVHIYSDGNLICFHKIYVTDQIDFSKYSVLNDYYEQIDKPEQDYIVKPTL